MPGQWGRTLEQQSRYPGSARGSAIVIEAEPSIGSLAHGHGIWHKLGILNMALDTVTH